MRRITREAADAFVNGRHFAKGNTCVDHWPEANVSTRVSRMLLHGNIIAVNSKELGLRMTLAGWNTPTTRERLNGLLEVLDKKDRFSQHNFTPFFGNIWVDEVREIESDEWITIT